MHRAIGPIATGLGLALAILVAPAGAAPVGIGVGSIEAALAEAGGVEPVRWLRRCWRDRYGDRRCRRVWVPDYGPGITLEFGGSRHYRGRGFRGDDFRDERRYRGRGDDFRGRSFRGDGRGSRGGGNR